METSSSTPVKHQTTFHQRSRSLRDLMSDEMNRREKVTYSFAYDVPSTRYRGLSPSVSPTKSAHRNKPRRRSTGRLNTGLEDPSSSSSSSSSSTVSTTASSKSKSGREKTFSPTKSPNRGRFFGQPVTDDRSSQMVKSGLAVQFSPIKSPCRRCDSVKNLDVEKSGMSSRTSRMFLREVSPTKASRSSPRRRCSTIGMQPLPLLGWYTDEPTTPASSHSKSPKQRPKNRHHENETSSQFQNSPSKVHSLIQKVIQKQLAI